MKGPLILWSSLAMVSAADLRGSAEALDQHGAVVPPEPSGSTGQGKFNVNPPPMKLVEQKIDETGTTDSAATASNVGPKSSKPNILMVLVDDQGHGDIDLGSDDKAEFHTPTLSMLAKDGVKLANFYSAATCTPSRAMLMTGRYTMRYGFQDSVIHATEPRGVPLSEKFLGEKLQEKGYYTTMIGKWHLGMHVDAYTPMNRGFDSFYGILTGGGSHTKHISVSQKVVARGQEDSHTFSGANLWDNDKFSPDNGADAHSTVLYTKRAMDMIQHLETTSADPWFIYLSYQAIHDPIEVGDERFITDTKCNAIDESSEPNRRIMCGMMAELDDGVRQIHNQLLTLSAWDRTVIVYASDNGGLISHGSSNAPFNGQKGTYYEGGVHVSAFLSGGFLTKAMASVGITEGFTMHNLAHITDLHSTAAALAGYDLKAETDAGLKLDGVNLWTQILQGKDSETVRPDVLINVNSVLFGDSGALRMGDYKLLINPDPAESTIYMKVKAHLQAQDRELTHSELEEYAKTQTKIIVDGKRHIYNVVMNPGEADVEEGCDNVEACTNLAGNPDFADIEDNLMAAFTRYKSAAEPSTFTWQDDGAIANPMFFGNLWSPWRDANGSPKVVYAGLLQGEQGFSTAFTTLAAAASVRDLGVEGKASEVVTALVSGAALVALVALTAFKVGKNSGQRQPEGTAVLSKFDEGL